MLMTSTAPSMGEGFFAWQFMVAILIPPMGYPPGNKCMQMITVHLSIGSFSQLHTNLIVYEFCSYIAGCSDYPQLVPFPTDPHRAATAIRRWCVGKTETGSGVENECYVM